MRVLGSRPCLLLPLVIVGCRGATDDSCEVPTSEISAVALVVDSGWDIRATIDFEQGDRRGEGAPLRLCEADVLTIAGETVSPSEKASRVEYSLSLPVDAARTVLFSLDRSSRDERIDLEIELPAAFEVLSPMDGDTLALTEGPMIEWEPIVEGGAMWVRLSEALGEGPCVRPSGPPPMDEPPPPLPYREPAGVQAEDTGSHVIDGVVLAGDSCELSLELYRVALGDYPDSLTSGGRIEARVERYLDVVAAP